MAKPPKGVTAFTFMQEKVNCGKGTCNVCGGNRFEHGPYWYAYWQKATGKTGKVYVGKNLAQWCHSHGVTSITQAGKTPKTPKAKPEGGAAKNTPKKGQTPSAKSETPKSNPDFARMLTNAATPLLAAKLLGVKPGITRGILTCAFRDRIKTAHPDKGGSHEEAAAITAAYAMLKPLVK